jgi:hypothetical protein
MVHPIIPDAGKSICALVQLYYTTVNDDAVPDLDLWHYIQLSVVDVSIVRRERFPMTDDPYADAICTRAYHLHGTVNLAKHEEAFRSVHIC